MDNYFKTLNDINVNGHTEKKGNLTYLSWAWAWAEVKKVFPDATYTVYENPTVGLPYFTDGKTCMVKTGVTINGIEHIEFLPIMDFKNKSIPVEAVTSMDINKAIQRSLTKAVARHGLGLYIYAGEDLPEAEDDTKQKQDEFVDDKAITSLENAIQRTELKLQKSIDREALAKMVGAKSLMELTAKQYGDVLRKLNAGESK